MDNLSVRIDDLVKAVEKDSLCQECAQEKIAPALISLLNEVGKDIPDWLEKKIRNK